MKSPTDVASGIILLGLCGIGAYSVRSLPEAGMEAIGPATFPKIILVLLCVLSLALLGDLFLSMENPPFAANGAFSISTALFLLIALPLLGRRKPVEIVAVAAITTSALVGVFSGFFQVLLP